MIPLSHVAGDDCDQIFADWGTPALLEEVSRYYDPQTGELEESEAATDITLIVGPDTASLHSQTQAAAPAHERMFLIRERELPSEISLSSARVRLGETTYSVQTVIASPLNGVLALHCISDRRGTDTTAS